MATTTKAPARKAFELHVEVNPAGEVTPVVPVTWTISEEMVGQIEKAAYTNPHVLLMVASRVKKEYGDEYTYRYDVSDVYAVPLTGTPKEYIKFVRPGDSVIVGFIVDIAGDWVVRDIANWQKNPHHVRFEINEKKNTIAEFWSLNYLASFVQRVTVPAGLFAPPPPKFLRALVQQYFPAYAVDQCHFRKRVIFSSLLSIPVQLYGVFARLFTLLYGVFMLQRGMTAKSFFALNPHDFGNSFQGSFWLEDKEGRDRQGFLWKLTPPRLVMYAIVAITTVVAVSIVPFAVMGIKYGDAVFEKFSIGEFLLWALLCDTVVAIIVGLILLRATYKGRELKRRFQRWMREHLPQTDYDAERERKAAEQETAQETMMRKLRERALAGTQITQAGDVADNSIHLLFHRTKMAVCKPFARSANY